MLTNRFRMARTVNTPSLRKNIENNLLFTQFNPATSFGQPMSGQSPDLVPQQPNRCEGLTPDVDAAPPRPALSLSESSILNASQPRPIPEPGATVIEIGPGRGALTEYLLAAKRTLIAIEVDQVLVHYLQAKFHGQTNFTILNEDVLKADLSAWGPVTIAGNLPYYITSPIFERVLSLGSLLHNAVFLVQKEVAERIAATPGTSRLRLSQRPDAV